LKRNPDVTRFGWVVVGVILVASGTELAWTGKLYGRVRVGGEPALEGALVVVIGLVEIVAGLLVLWRQARRV
jgi:hypothetical protein